MFSLQPESPSSSFRSPVPRVLRQHLFLLLSLSTTAAIGICTNRTCKLLDPCSSADDCSPGLYCGNCPSAGKSAPVCTRGQATRPASIVKDLPFNRYSWLVTHNSFSIMNEPSYTGTPRVTFYNQEDSVTNQLMNGVRGLMLDMYDFRGDIWLCHSFRGQCFDFTAFLGIQVLYKVPAEIETNHSS